MNRHEIIKMLISLLFFFQSPSLPSMFLFQHRRNAPIATFANRRKAGREKEIKISQLKGWTHNTGRVGLARQGLRWHSDLRPVTV